MTYHIMRSRTLDCIPFGLAEMTLFRSVQARSCAIAAARIHARQVGQCLPLTRQRCATSRA